MIIVIKKIKFSFIFDDYNTIESKKLSLRNADSIGVSNPAKISYQYNEQKNTFDVIQTIIYVAENGELTTKDIEITDTANDIVLLKSETLSTDYYIRIREEEERIAEEKRKIELEEQRKLEEEKRIAKEKKEKKLLAIAQKMNNWQDVSKYSEEDIFETFETHFDPIAMYGGMFDYDATTKAIFNIEQYKNRNIFFRPIQIFQIIPNKGMLGVVTTYTYLLGEYMSVKARIPKSNLVYIEYKNTNNFINNQSIKIFAKILGSYTYITTEGKTNTIPKLKAYFIKKIKS